MKIEETIEQSIHEFNKSQNKYKIINNENFELIGQNSLLDSLAIVSFFSVLEDKILSNHGIKRDLMKEVFIQQDEMIDLKKITLILKNN
jgi:hypothetical protein|tara:strand:+ start:249 stop:515 length:267 start_codon:yes stop_codon:yes gene_type:complete